MYEAGLFELRAQLCYVRYNESGPLSHKIELIIRTLQMIGACFFFSIDGSPFYKKSRMYDQQRGRKHIATTS